MWDLVLWQGVEPRPLHWQHGVLAGGPHGSLHLLLNSVCLEHTDHWSDYNIHSSVFSLIFNHPKIEIGFVESYVVSSSIGRTVFVSVCFYIWIGNEGTTSLSLCLHFFFLSPGDRLCVKPSEIRNWRDLELDIDEWAPDSGFGLSMKGFSLLHFKISGTLLWWLFLSCLS